MSQSSEMASTIPRIPYIIGCPNEIWHFDGNHKLINWGFIISAAMDGATKRLAWVRVTSNNYATTVLEFFEDAMQELGIPQHVRSDKGGENILVLQKMFELRSDADCPAIAGKSTRNTRIERWWFNLNSTLVSQFLNLFETLQSEGILNN